MAELILPTIGSSGYYELRAPFDTIIIPYERYTCQAIRKISEYLANNENPKTLIYDKYQLTEDDYTSDAEQNMSIVSLQSAKGHWLYVPARYIVTYPITNGIPYRSIMIGVSLPSIPAEKDLSNLETDIGNLIVDTLGVTPAIRLVETSRVVLIPKDKHDITQSTRDATANGRLTDRSRYMSLLLEHQAALDKITALETYIKDNHT